jgi:hypothetical protein
MLWEFVAKLRANFVVALAVVTIRRSEPGEVRYRLNIPSRVACQALGVANFLCG